MKRDRLRLCRNCLREREVLISGKFIATKADGEMRGDDRPVWQVVFGLKIDDRLTVSCRQFGICQGVEQMCHDLSILQPPGCDGVRSPVPATAAIILSAPPERDHACEAPVLEDDAAAFREYGARTRPGQKAVHPRLRSRWRRNPITSLAGRRPLRIAAWRKV